MEKDKLYFIQKSCNFSQFHAGQAQVSPSDTQLQVPLKILVAEKTTAVLVTILPFISMGLIFQHQ